MKIVKTIRKPQSCVLLALLQKGENLNELSLSGTTFSIITGNRAFFAKMFNRSFGQEG